MILDGTSVMCHCSGVWILCLCVHHDLCLAIASDAGELFDHYSGHLQEVKNVQHGERKCIKNKQRRIDRQGQDKDRKDNRNPCTWLCSLLGSLQYNVCLVRKPCDQGNKAVLNHFTVGGFMTNQVQRELICGFGNSFGLLPVLTIALTHFCIGWLEVDGGNLSDLSTFC